MTDNCYLSLDIDYFLSYESCDGIVERPLWTLCKFLSKIKHVDNRIFVKDHHEILDHINTFKPDKIIHVDFHQDIVYPTENFGRRKIELNEGTFLYFVKNRKNIDFIWHYPDSSLRHCGLCMDLGEKPFSKKNHIFKTQRCKQGLPSKKVLSSVKAVGVALSVPFLSHNLTDDIDRLVSILEKRFNLKLSPDYEASSSR